MFCLLSAHVSVKARLHEHTPDLEIEVRRKRLSRFEHGAVLRSHTHSMQLRVAAQQLQILTHRLLQYARCLSAYDYGDYIKAGHSGPAGHWVCSI